LRYSKGIYTIVSFVDALVRSSTITANNTNLLIIVFSFKRVNYY